MWIRHDSMRASHLRPMTLAAFLLVLLHPAAAQQRSLEGVFVNEAQNAAAIEAAIGTTVAKMNFIARPIARGRLRKDNPAYRRVVIVLAPEEISVAFDDDPPVRMPAGGDIVKGTGDGEALDVSAHWQGEKLMQTFKAKDGQRTNTFSLGADGLALQLDAEITSPRLPVPVRYTLSFARVPGERGG